MTSTLAAESAVLLSIYKPILMLLVMLGWGHWVSMLDKDAEYFYLPRQRLNAMNVGVGAVAFLLWLLIPMFWIGLPLALLLLVGAGVGYSIIRNKEVPEAERWHLSADLVRDFLLKRREAAAQKEATLRFITMGSGSSSSFKPVPLAEDPNYQSHLALEELLNAAFARHAQRIELAVSGQEVAVQFTIDGVAYRQEPIEPAAAVAMISYLKAEVGLDVEDRRRRQTGEIRVDTAEHGQHTLKVSTAGSTRGVTCSIEIDPRAQLEIPYAQIGLINSQKEKLQPVLDEGKGLVIVASPGRQGRTATLYALLQQHDPYMMDIHTIEQPIELDLEGVTQHEPGAEGWERSLNSLLLRDPAVVMLGQLPDEATAKRAAEAAAADSRLYVSLKADDTFAALRAWMKVVGDKAQVAEGLRAILAQRLVRKLCPTCRQAYRPDAAALKKLNLPAEKINELYKASGKVQSGREEQTCPTCNGIGYLGRSAAFELMVVDDVARDHIRAGDANALRSHLRKQGMLWLQEAALAKVVNGETSITEVMRVLGGESSGKKTAKRG